LFRQEILEIGNFGVWVAFVLVSLPASEGNAMAKRGRPTVEIVLTIAERGQLESWARRHSSAQSLALRCRIVLACADPELSRQEIAERVGCNPATVTKWRNRFARDRLDGLVDEPRPGAARSIGDDVIEQVVIDTLETAPPDATHWSTRSLAARHGISHETVSQIWQAFGLKPWREDEFKVSPDPQLIEKIRDLVGLYMNPPVNAAVFAVDEKPQIQALNRTAPTLPMLPTTPARATHDYQRNGTIDLFAALNIATGKVITDLRPNHTSAEFIKFLNKINREVPAELDVHVIVDNLSTHKTPAVHKWLLRHRRFHFHFTPTYGSWMNLVERWFSALTTKKLQRSAHDSVAALAADITAWVDHWNENPTPFVWTKTADEILDRLARYCAAVTNTEYDGAST
jgi:transposase